MNATTTVAPAVGSVVANLLSYQPQQKVVFDYAGHTLAVVRGGRIAGVEYSVTELDEDSDTITEWYYVLNATCRYFNGTKEFAVQTMFGEVLAETVNLEAALGALLAHVEG